MEKDLTPELARALDLLPDEILGYKWYATGYAVITKDFRKHIDVQPVMWKPADENRSANGDDAGGSGTDAPPEYPAEMPDELKLIYRNPRNFKLQEVRKLAYFLQIRDASALRKLPLLDEIDLWKREHR